MSKNTSIKNFTYVGIGKMVATGFQSGLYVILATLLDPEFYGQLSYIVALAGIFATVSRFGLGNTVIVYQAKKNSTMVSQVNLLVLITTGAAAVILISIDPFAALLCLGFNFFTMNQANLLGLRNYKKFGLNAIWKSVLLISIPILIYFVLDISGIILGMAISNLIASTDYFKLLSRKFNSFQDIKKNYKVIVNNFGVDAATHFPFIIDKLLIVPLFGFLFVGIYQFNLQVLFALGLLPIVLHSFLLSETSSGKSNTKITYAAIFGSIILSIIAIFLAPTVISEFFPKFQDGVTGLQIMLLSLLPLTISSIFTARLQAEESTKVGLPGLIRLASLAILLVILGEFYGLRGLALGVLFSTIIYSISLAWLYYKSQT